MMSTSTMRTRRFLAVVAAGALLVPAGISKAAGEVTLRVNVTNDGHQSAPGASGLHPSVSQNGRRVVFTSAATDIFAGAKDDAAFNKVFMRDYDNHRTVLISVSSSGARANGPSYFPLINGNGDSVLFTSEASNLVPDDNNGVADVFVRNLVTHKTYLVSDRRGKSRATANGASWGAGISNVGNDVLFVTSATNLVRDSVDTNGAEDVYSWHYQVLQDGSIKKRTHLVSHRYNNPLATGNAVSGGAIGGGEIGGAALSGNGNCAAFGSNASNLIGFPDTNDVADVYLLCGLNDVGTVNGRRVSQGTGPDQEEGDFASFGPSLGSGGSFVAYYSHASNLVPDDTNLGGDLFLARLSHSYVDSVERINVHGDGSQDLGGAVPLGPQAISDDGRKVAFASFGQLAPPTDCSGEQVYIRDTQAKTTDLVSIQTDDTCGKGFSNYTAISDGGKYVVWLSAASGLVSNDTNGAQDVFIRGIYF